MSLSINYGLGTTTTTTTTPPAAMSTGTKVAIGVGVLALTGLAAWGLSTQLAKHKKRRDRRIIDAHFARQHRRA